MEHEIINTARTGQSFSVSTEKFKLMTEEKRELLQRATANYLKVLSCTEESKSALQPVPENVPVVIREELQSLIGTVKNIKLVTTYDEVLAGLRTYVWEKKLYDPLNPIRVWCKGDALGSVFGTEEFTVFNVKTFLQKLVTPVNKISKDSPEVILQSVSENSVKRKLDECSEQDVKKICGVEFATTSVSPLVLQLPPTPEKCDSSDSPDSIQGYETAFATDHSDNFSSSVYSDDFFSNEGRIVAVEEVYDLEYEVDTDDDDDPFSSYSSCSDSDAEIAAEVALDAAVLRFVCRTDSDIEFFADDSSDEDEEIPESDHWKCVKCEFSNPPPMRYCSRCWEERLEWFPEKSQQNEPRSPSKKRRKSRKSRGSAVCSSSSQEIGDKHEANFSKSSQDSQGSSCLETESLPPTAADTHLGGTCDHVPKLCIICCEKPANASIIHSKYAHQICCYRCARKLQKQKKRCPICRRTIDRVVHQISNI